MMRRLLRALILVLLTTTQAFATLAAGTVWELNASATASNVNGGGFNTQNANFLTDLACTSATGTAPVCTSASFNFVARQNNTWLFIRSGTNWNTSGAGTAGGGCYFQITSTAANAATVNAAVGAARCLSTGTAVNLEVRWVTNTSAGTASVASPTGGTFGVDYSQGTAAGVIVTDGVVGAVTTELTSALTPVDLSWVGNILHTNSGATCTTGWFEIVSVSGTTATVDRSLGTATAVCAQRLGGAMSLNSTLDDDFFESGVAGNIFWLKAGAFTFGETVTLAAAGGTQNPIVVAGYQTARGDKPTIANGPTIATVTFSFVLAANWNLYNLDISNSSTSTGDVLTLGTNSAIRNLKVKNRSTTAAQDAIITGAAALIFNTEAISYRGRAIQSALSLFISGCYLHDSDIGIRISANVNLVISNCIIASNVTDAAIVTTAVSTGYLSFQNVTLYGTEAKQGVGIDLVTGTRNVHLINSIIYGFVTGVTHADVQTASFDDYNTYNNNTTNATNWVLGKSSLTTAPAFTSVAQLTGATATTSGSVLTQGGGDFSTVVDGQDYLYLVSGTGITAGMYGITAHTATTVTLDIAPGTDATADKVWRITTGRNWGVGTAMKAAGFPGLFSGAVSTGYTDIGAVQRIEGAGGQRATGFVQ